MAHPVVVMFFLLGTLLFPIQGIFSIFGCFIARLPVSSLHRRLDLSPQAQRL
jgi:hypothetical protein